MAEDRQSADELYETASDGDEAYETAREIASIPFSERPRVPSRFVESPFASRQPQLIIDSFLNFWRKIDELSEYYSSNSLSAESSAEGDHATEPAPADASSQTETRAASSQLALNEMLPVERFSDEVLISDGSPEGRPDEMIFLTRRQFVDKYGHPPTPEETDERAVLQRDSEGNYETKQQAYNSIRIKTTVPRGQRAAKRREIFSARMRALGLSAKRFENSKVTASYVDTPAGSRWREFTFAYPLQSGQDNPDMLIRSSDGAFLAVYPKLRPDFHPFTIKEIAEQRGAKNVWQKDLDRSYCRLDHCGSAVAQDIYEKFLRTYNPHNQPNILVRRDQHSYAAGQTFQEALQTARTTGGNPNDGFLLRPEALLRARNGKTVVKPSTLEWLSDNSYNDEDYYRRTVEALDLPGEVEGRWFEDAPSLLVADPRNPKIYLDGQYFRAITGRSITSQKDTAILVQNRSDRGGTGNFATLAYVLDPASGKSLTAEQKQIIGREVTLEEWRFDHAVSSSSEIFADERYDASGESDEEDRGGRRISRGMRRIGAGRKRTRSISPPYNSDSGAEDGHSRQRKRIRLSDNTQESLTVTVPLEDAYLRLGQDYFRTAVVIERHPEHPLAKKMIAGDAACDLLYKAPDGHTVLPVPALFDEIGEAARVQIGKTGRPAHLAEQPSTAPAGPPALINSGKGRLMPFDSKAVTEKQSGGSVIETFGPDRTLIRMENGGYRTYAATLHYGDAISAEAAAAIGVEPRESSDWRRTP